MTRELCRKCVPLFVDSDGGVRQVVCEWVHTAQTVQRCVWWCGVELVVVR